MNAPNDNTAVKGLREWWLSPPRPGMRRLINPWEYRHLRAFGVTRILGGSVAAGAGVVCLAYDAYGWAAFFLVIGALNLGGGYWYLTIDRSAGSAPLSYEFWPESSWSTSLRRSFIRNVWCFWHNDAGNTKHLFDLDGHMGKFRVELLAGRGGHARQFVHVGLSRAAQQAVRFKEHLMRLSARPVARD